MNANYPKAYKEGIKDFYGRDFKVTRDTLIPRPETEMIIDAVLNLTGKPYLPGVKAAPAKLPDDLTILDVGTGSGCLAITLKLELPKATVYATDVSSRALAVAKQNAKHFDTDVAFQKSDLLQNISITPDVIVANLPYVDATWDWLNKEQSSCEPPVALYAEDGGLKLIKDLIATTPPSTKFLILEADPCQHLAIIEYAKKHNFVLHETRDFALIFAKNLLPRHI